MQDKIAELFKFWSLFYGFSQRKSIKFTTVKQHDNVVRVRLRNGECGVTAYAVAAVMQELYDVTPLFHDNQEHGYFSVVLEGVRWYFDADHPAGTRDEGYILGFDPESPASTGDFDFMVSSYMPIDSLGWELCRVFFVLRTGKDFDALYPQHKNRLEFDYEDVYVRK